MDEEYTPLISEEERAARRARRAELRRQKRRARQLRQLRAGLLCAALILALVFLLRISPTEAEPEENPPPVETAETVAAETVVIPETPYSAAASEATVHLGEDLSSEYAVLIDLATDTILAEKNAWTSISPASMTKILTILVASEQDPELTDTFTMTREITDYCYVNGCSVVGFSVDETVPVEDLFYGTILPSGADAALGLAIYTAGSHEDFVALMNEKLAELGLSETAHFTNCVGLYDAEHFCTVYDMAVILKAAMDDPLCRQVLSAHTYQTASTEAHPEGLSISNWFLRRIEDKDTGSITVLGAKTGYVVQSGSCAASYGLTGDGGYLCVTGNASSSWRAIYDHVTLYKEYTGQE